MGLNPPKRPRVTAGLIGGLAVALAGWLAASTTTAAHATPAAAKPSSAHCTATAYLASSDQWFVVTIHSNQPHKKVVVTGVGESFTAHTNAAGYATLQFDADPLSRGKPFTARVGAARCSGHLGQF
jgi:hypothetical protein